MSFKNVLRLCYVETEGVLSQCAVRKREGKKGLLVRFSFANGEV